MKTTAPKSTHTDGPWQVSLDKYGVLRDVTAIDGCALVARVNPVMTGDLANARLIAAAPDLLAALKQCENVIGMARLQGKLSDNPFSEVNDALLAAHAALDKVR